MTLLVAGLILLAALAHASWNAMLKSGADRLWVIAAMQATQAVVAGACLPFVPVPPPETWPYLAASTVIHFFYRLALIWGYRHGDLGEIYPIARGLSPLLVTLVAALWIGEVPGLWPLAGIVLVCGGIFALRFAGPRRLPPAGFAIAALTGCLIAGYTLCDGLGARLSGHAVGFALWLFFLGGVSTSLWYFGTRGLRHYPGPRETAKGVIGSIIGMLGYGVVVWASTLGPMGAVSALRETSVVIAALLGWLFLDERLGWQRLLACVVVTLGAICIAIGARPPQAPPERPPTMLAAMPPA